VKFVLVHGAWHGGWCWEPLVHELEQLGHDVLAPNLPCDDTDAGLGRYVEVIGRHPDAVVVAHSLAGLVLPLIEAALHVYLCALVPTPGQPFAGSFDEALDPAFGGTERDELGRSYWPSVGVLAERLYRGHDRRWAEWAFAQLRRQAQTPSREPCPLEELPHTRCAYILATEDPSVRPAWSRLVARELLGVEPQEIEGGHFPMLDRPAELARMLETLTASDRARR